VPHRRHEPERICIVTRAVAPVDALIRFVVAPDGEVVPDLRRRLPGRGIWVTAKADHVETAERKRLFARAHGGPVKLEPGLAGRVDKGLANAALAALSMARKAGTAVAGFAKVEAALARGEVVALIHAAEAGSDGIAKLAAAAHRRRRNAKPDVIRSFGGEELDLAFGRPNVIHAALLAGPASSNLLACIEAWRAFRCDEHDAARDEPAFAGVRANRDSVSPGQRNA
jgi:predicted RNA-binding protein YlxR (DUF448 family)